MQIKLVSILTNSNLPACQCSFKGQLQREAARVCDNPEHERADVHVAAPIVVWLSLRLLCHLEQENNVHQPAAPGRNSRIPAALSHKKIPADIRDPPHKASQSMERWY